MGYEDLNDHQSLRRDVAIQTGVDRCEVLAGASRLCRFGNRADRESAWRMHEVLVDPFIQSFKRAPKKLILDFDAPDDAAHGRQHGRFFHGYYDQYCFLAGSAVGALSAPEQDRWGETRLGGIVAVTSSVAQGEENRSRR